MACGRIDATLQTGLISQRDPTVSRFNLVAQEICRYDLLDHGVWTNDVEDDLPRRLSRSHPRSVVPHPVRDLPIAAA